MPQQVLGDLRLGTRAGKERRIARTWPTFKQMLDYVAGDLTDRSTYLQLARRMHRPAEWQLIVYVAVPPELIAHVKAELSNAGFLGSDILVAVEEPFGPPPPAEESGKSFSATETCLV